MANITYREALNQALSEEMERDPNVFLMGEEVGYYQGAYKVSQGLLEKFGPDRVKDTPIAETGFTGVGIGAAMVGMRPIIEVMTFNFSLVCIDQIINNAAKIRYMSGGQFKIPMVLRGPGGVGGRLAAQHSQNFESFYTYVPGLKVVMPSVPYDAKGLLKAAVREDNPVIFIEAERLYNTKGEVPDGEYTLPIGAADVKREGSDVTIVAWSRMVLVALKAAEELAKEGVSAEVVDPRTLRPLDDELIFESVRKTNRCVVVEEGWRYAGFGAEVADRVQRGCFDDLDAPVERVTGEDVPMPYAGNLEAAAIPDAPRVIAAAKRALYR
jgi:pyruvate dehydrogenase E1 component beta subunit